MNDITPGQVYRETGRWFGPALVVGLAVLVLALILGLVGWKAHWWFAARDAANQTRVIENGPGYQTAKTDDLNSQIANVTDLTTSLIGTSGSERDALHAQRLGDARLACADASQITTIPADQRGWVTANCADGTLSSSSPLLK